MLTQNTTEVLYNWAAALTPAQMRPLLVTLVKYACDAEDVRFGEFPPYWVSSCDPLVAGQSEWEDK